MKSVNRFIIRNIVWITPLGTYGLVFLCIWLGTRQYADAHDVWSLLFLMASLLVIAPLVQLVTVRFLFQLKPYRGEHREKLIKYCQTRSVDRVEFFEVNGTLPNAHATGNKKHKRVTFTRRLLTDFSYGEIEAVLAHELGHHVHNDPSSSVRVIIFIFLFASWLNVEIMLRTHIDLFVISVVSSIIFYLLFMMRSRGNERFADKYAARDPKAAKGLVSFFQKSQEIYQKEGVWMPKPLPFLLRIARTHPALEERMKILTRRIENETI